MYELTELIENCTHIKVLGSINEEKVYGDLGNIVDDEFVINYSQAVIEKSKIIDYVEEVQ